MNEAELNRQIEYAETQRLELLPMPPRRQTGRAYRRMMKVRKYQWLRKIDINRYVPYVGYVDCAFIDGHSVPTGKYIKFPKNSNCQKWIKRETSRRQRNCEDMPIKGNYYRRLFDYWWTLY